MDLKKQYTWVVVLCVLATSALSLSLGHEILSKKHETWMVKHGRHYQSMEEKEERLEIFKANLEKIERFNKENNTYKLGVNQFADLTNEEFLAKYGGVMEINPTLISSSNRSDFIYSDVMVNGDQSLDWRQYGVVTPVKFQGPCGSCWAFSAVAAIEGIVGIRTGKSTQLSEQYILDCNYGHDGCSGGWFDHAFDFVLKSGGLPSEGDYPYTAVQGACINRPSSLATRLVGVGYVPSANEAALLQAVSNQPVAVAVDTTLFQFYQSGVLRGEGCGKRLTHAITAVGYGEEDGIKFWLFKNSWGPMWGEGGYIRMERDVADRAGTCGIALYASFPIA